MTPVHLKNNRDPEDRMPGEQPRIVPKSSGWQVKAHGHAWSPPTDLYETETRFVVRVEIAGLRDKEFSVTLDNNYLVIYGTRSDVPERRAYHQMEIRFGEFNTVVALPGAVDPDKTTAVYSDGFLVVELPKIKS